VHRGTPGQLARVACASSVPQHLDLSWNRRPQRVEPSGSRRKVSAGATASWIRHAVRYPHSCSNRSATERTDSRFRFRAGRRGGALPLCLFSRAGRIDAGGQPRDGRCCRHRWRCVVHGRCCRHRWREGDRRCCEHGRCAVHGRELYGRSPELRGRHFHRRERGSGRRRRVAGGERRKSCRGQFGTGRLVGRSRRIRWRSERGCWRSERRRKRGRQGGGGAEHRLRQIGPSDR
jgi:hypothetical protein